MVGGIYSPNHPNGRWGRLLSYGVPDSPVRHRTVRCATGHCPVRQPCNPTGRVRPLELLTCGPPDSPVVHRTGPVQCPVRQPCNPTVRVRPLELLTCGPPDSPVVHRTGPVHCPVRHLTPALTSAREGAHCSVSLFLCRRPLALYSHYSAGTPDSPVLHRTVR
jgi:hypothetical protein